MNKKWLFWFIVCLFFIGITIHSASASWWNASYPYKMQINVTNANTKILYNYSTFISVNNSNAPAHWNWASSNSIRFINSSDTGTLTFFTETYNNFGATNFSGFWVKIPVLPIGTTSIYLYYGAVGASSVSNPKATFIYWENFDIAGNLNASIWDTDNAGGSQNLVTYREGSASRAWTGTDAITSTNMVTGFSNITYGTWVRATAADTRIRMLLYDISAGNVFDHSFHQAGSDVYRTPSGGGATIVYYNNYPENTWAYIESKPNKLGTASETCDYEIYDNTHNLLGSFYNSANWAPRAVDEVNLNGRATGTGTGYIDAFRVRPYARNEPTYVIGNEIINGTVITVNWGIPHPLNNTQFNSNPVNLWVLANVSGVTSWNCSLYINGTLQVNSTQILSNGTNINCSFQINITTPSMYNYLFNANISATPNSSIGWFYFDNVNPIITILNWSNNTIRYNTNITGSWNITDNFYLHRLNATIDGVQVFGIIDINATQYWFNLSSSVTGLSPGNHVLSIQVADGHTANSIVTDSYDWSNGLFNDYLKYEFRPPYDETYINIVNKESSIWDSWKTTPLKDRYTFSFEPGTVTKTITLDITSNSKISIAKNKELTWLIFNDHWLDFAPYQVNFNTINDYYVQAIIQNPGMDEKLEFNSIGDLNIVTRNYTFATTNMTVVYSTLVNELSYTTSTLTILKNAAIINTSAAFSWNGTLYNITADRSNASFDFYNITYFINAIGAATATVPIVWFYNVTGTVNNLTGNITLNQTVLQIGIDNCSVYTVRAINITLLDEGNNTPINGSIDGYFNVWVAAMSAFRSFNLTWRGDSSYGLCINNGNVTYLTNGQMEYYAPAYTTKTYYLVNETLDNTTEILNLYLTLNTTQVILAVFDENGDPIKNVYVHVQSYDLGTNSYHTTEITRTDYKGESFAQMILNTQWYQFMLVYNGATVLQTDPTKIIDTYLAFQINLGSISLSDWIESKDVTCNIRFNNATNNFRMDFSNPTGNAVTATLNVYNSSIFSKQLIGSNTLNAASGTLLVNIGTPGNFTYVGSGVLTINGYQYPCGSSVTINYGGDYHTWGLQGIFYLMLLIIAAATTFIFGPEISIIAVLAVLGIGWFAGLIGLGGGSIITIIIIGGIIVYRLTRK